MAELSTTEKLAEARTALHKLLTGTQMVNVGYGERRIQYTQANIDALRQYIKQLEIELAGASAPARRPFRVIY